MASPHRLSDQDVQVIFSCIKDNKRPPAKLAFRIIRVPPSGLKLSPPSFEFAGNWCLLFAYDRFSLEMLWLTHNRIDSSNPFFTTSDGIYVFLRSQNKLPATIPSNLSDKWISDCELALMPACPWSLSGPQFSKPLCMQQRYCYPRGNPLYSDNKGGALWTMVSGDEDVFEGITTYRIHTDILTRFRFYFFLVNSLIKTKPSATIAECCTCITPTSALLALARAEPRNARNMMRMVSRVQPRMQQSALKLKHFRYISWTMICSFLHFQTSATRSIRLTWTSGMPKQSSTRRVPSIAITTHSRLCLSRATPQLLFWVILLSTVVLIYWSPTTHFFHARAETTRLKIGQSQCLLLLVYRIALSTKGKGAERKTLQR